MKSFCFPTPPPLLLSAQLISLRGNSNCACAVSTFAPKVKQIQIHINLILILFKNVKKNIATGKMSQVITSLTIIVDFSCYHFFDFELT